MTIVIGRVVGRYLLCIIYKSELPFGRSPFLLQSFGIFYDEARLMAESYQTHILVENHDFCIHPPIFHLLDLRSDKKSPDTSRRKQLFNLQAQC